jgi:urease accessory protein
MSASPIPFTSRGPDSLVSEPDGRSAAAGIIGGAELVLLATWFSPAFPVGGFSYSHGLETAIVTGVVRAGASLSDWISLLLASGSGWNDAVLATAAYRAASTSDLVALRGVADVAEAGAPSAERLLETMSLGSAFLKAVATGWPTAHLQQMSEHPGERAAYPIAVGIAAAAHNLPLPATLTAMLNAFATTLISVAVRLVPLGQTAGLQALAGLQPVVLSVAERAANSTLDDLGSAAILSDIAAMRHEMLYSRIFRS